MLAITYREPKKRGVTYLPMIRRDMGAAKAMVDGLHKKGYLNVKIVEIEEKEIYIPGGDKNENR